MSAKSGQDSSNISGSFIEFFVRIFDSDFENLSSAEQELIISNYQFFVRKFAHFSIYALLGFFTVGFLNTYNNLKCFKSGIFSQIFVTFYAVTDEFHQLFSPDRSGQLSDVLLDSVGGMVGIIIMFLIFRAVITVLEARSKNEIK